MCFQCRAGLAGLLVLEHTEMEIFLVLLALVQHFCRSTMTYFFWYLTLWQKINHIYQAEVEM